MDSTPNVVKLVVQNDLCTGCGLCVYKCPSKAIEMDWNKYGFLVPRLTGNCDSSGDCITVCPFNPYPAKEVQTENELADIFLTDACQSHPKIGRYENNYVGYAHEFRLTSSSGGLATFITTELLENKIVDHIFSVKESQTPGTHYEYTVSSSRQEILAAAKTKYYPVTLASVFNKINELDGKVAIVGIACFIKAIRLAQFNEPELRNKIPFLIGIICGGIKSRFFTEYLAEKAGVSSENCIKPEFRIKDISSSASDYSFGCVNREDDKPSFLKMRTVGDMWGTGLFKANACDFCDDVTTELADISLGDAWINPYIADGKGTNIIISRSKIADNLLQNGIQNKKLQLEELSLEKLLASQHGSFNHRQNALSYRVSQAKKKKKVIPFLRAKDYASICIDFKVVQKLRLIIRSKSLKIWMKLGNSQKFDEKIKKYLITIWIATFFYHQIRIVRKKFEK